MQLNQALVGDNIAVLLKAVLDHSWLTPVEIMSWTKVLAARVESTPNMQHSICSLVSFHAQNPDQSGSVRRFNHHLRASELFHNLTLVVTKSDWAASRHLEPLYFELAAQTYCLESEFSIANTIRMFRWGRTIEKEAKQHFQSCHKQWTQLLTAPSLSCLR